MLDKETVIDLVKEAMKTQDNELLVMAKNLLSELNSGETTESATPPKKRGPTKKTATKKKPVSRKKSTKDLVEQFTLKKKNDKIRYEPVKWTGNTWTDDKTECVGEEFETPKIKLATRERSKPEMVEVTCGLDPDGEPRTDAGCNQKFKIKASDFVSDMFLCEDCREQLIKKRGRVRK